MTDTVAWAKSTNAAQRARPTFMETYRASQNELETRQAGARPISLCAFTDALSIDQL